jgi:hypothetical protein
MLGYRLVRVIRLPKEIRFFPDPLCEALGFLRVLERELQLTPQLLDDGQTLSDTAGHGILHDEKVSVRAKPEGIAFGLHASAPSTTRC